MLAFVRHNARWLAAGALLTFASSAGQTFFIALFADDLRAATGLGHGAWGSLYAAATLGSALLLGFAGPLADRRPMALPASVVLALTALGALAMSVVGAVWVLVVAVFLLRFASQGLASHVAMTAAARWFTRTRGRALAVTSLGHPLGEAVLPGLVVVLAAAIGWRGTWLVVASILALVLAPIVAWLGRLERRPRHAEIADGEAGGLVAGLDGRHWGRAEVLRHPLFWALVPGVLASPFMGTALLFQASPLMAAKGWSLELYALAFPAYAVLSVVGGLAGGLLVDRSGPVVLLPFLPVPLALGLFLAGGAEGAVTAFAMLGLVGLTTGAVFTVTGALWAHLYGTAHLGGVRGLVGGVTVFGTALAPGVTGLLLELGVGLERQFTAMGAVALLLAGLLAAVARHLAPRRTRAA